ncbi:uracil-xanthine permease family protein [Amphritea sp. 2_MG-2023]|jgi:uracil permease|uniref:uracil-xanthine permease family protein n=1 Tax=Amphritea TaxID=515417 RepID=UPI001C0715CA|nr:MULTISPECIES: uracil-xanthine permease family protein [Amphritea]MBU2967499.1 uracil-xanthine permease family protein [Amphritea atlantica]MDO6420505.1 uracil-xanthine permease family protein [Amphritea sp. 2_MG-2023]MDX2424051.1 uracil-xanthine permease family protein [Amphritea sp.]
MTGKVNETLDGSEALWRTVLAGSQMLFVAFGALVLMPLLTGMDPSVALFTAGLGTLLFQFVTKRQVPVFLASSFAFIAPIIYSTSTWGMPATMGALFCAGLVYMLLALAVKFRGVGFLHRLLPPVVVGPVIMVIGLGLAPVAVNMAMGKAGDGSIELFPYIDSMIVSMSALATTLLVATLGKGIFRLLPIMAGVVVGYLMANFFGMVNYQIVADAAFLAVPAFVLPELNWQAILFMIPVAIAPAVEHVGDVLAIGHVTGKDYIKKPGLHRTLFGDGLATSAAALFGGPPNTTYSEVTGAVMLTRSFNPMIMIWAAVFAILLAFVAKFGILLQTIPSPVMGGILILLFGSIAAVGLNTLIKARVDLAEQRNLVIVATTLVFGIGGMVVGQGEFSMQGVSLCGVVAILLNLLLPGHKPMADDLHEEQNVVDDLIDHVK